MLVIALGGIILDPLSKINLYTSRGCKLNCVSKEKK